MDWRALLAMTMVCGLPRFARNDEDAWIAALCSQRRRCVDCRALLAMTMVCGLPRSARNDDGVRIAALCSQ